MTAQLQPDTQTKPTSRRALLAGAIGGLGALAATAIGRPAETHAADGGNAILGQANTSTTETTFENTATGATSLKGIHSGGGTGLWGRSASGQGVYGESTGSGNGVYATSAHGNGVYAATGTGGAGVYGYSPTYGIRGDSTNVGIFGTGTVGGVTGSSEGGRGIQGTSITGFAGYFSGKVFMSRFQEMPEIATPPAPGIDKARIFVRDNGSGKTQLCVRFSTGGVHVIATQS